MPNLGPMHPYVVHVVIGFLIAGILLRWSALVPRWTGLSWAAAALLIAGTGASVVAAQSGLDAHGPVERVPGTREAVEAHQEWGERTRDLFLVISAVELLALAIPSRRRLLQFGSAALGIVGLWFVFETGEHGGELVYAYAGGVGIRTGDPEDIDRLLRAGLYQEAMKDRREGKGADAARLIDEMATRFPADTEVQLLRVESLLRDINQPQAALAALDSLQAIIQNPRLQRSMALTRVYALLAAGQKDSARAIVNRLVTENPGVPRFRALLDSIR